MVPTSLGLQQDKGVHGTSSKRRAPAGAAPSPLRAGRRRSASTLATLHAFKKVIAKKPNRVLSVQTPGGKSKLKDARVAMAANLRDSNARRDQEAGRANNARHVLAEEEAWARRAERAEKAKRALAKVEAQKARDAKNEEARRSKGPGHISDGAGRENPAPRRV